MTTKGVALLLCITLLSHVGPPASAEGDSRNLKSSGLPLTTFQVGSPRTATTMQYFMLCAAVAVKTLHEPGSSVDCIYIGKNSGNGDILYGSRRPKKSYQVIKTHGGLTPTQEAQLMEYSESVANGTSEAPAVYYTSSGNMSTRGVRKFQSKYDFPTTMTVDTADIAPDMWNATKALYEEKLGLSTQQSAMVFSWLDIWDKLRMCCGRQMSKQWRMHLLGVDEDPDGSAERFGNEVNAIEMCSNVNVSALEVELMDTALYKRMHASVPALGTVSDVDGQLTGSYCQSCQDRIVQFSLPHRENCSRSVEELCADEDYQDNEACQRRL